MHLASVTGCVSFREVLSTATVVESGYGIQEVLQNVAPGQKDLVDPLMFKVTRLSDDNAIPILDQQSEFRRATVEVPGEVVRRHECGACIEAVTLS
jgi:hypothetical protein